MACRMWKTPTCWPARRCLIGSMWPTAAFAFARGKRRPSSMTRMSALAHIARGIVEHHRDDAWFHETPAFHELSWQFTSRVKEILPEDEGFRPSFLGHILVEILLDAELIRRAPFAAGRLLSCPGVDRRPGCSGRREPHGVPIHRSAGIAGSLVLSRALLVGLPGRWQTAGAAESGHATRTAPLVARSACRSVSVGT